MMSAATSSARLKSKLARTARAGAGAGGTILQCCWWRRADEVGMLREVNDRDGAEREGQSVNSTTVSFFISAGRSGRSREPGT